MACHPYFYQRRNDKGISLKSGHITDLMKNQRLCFSPYFIALFLKERCNILFPKIRIHIIKKS